MTERSRIDAELDGVRLSPDGSRLILLLHDATGQRVSLSLPMQCLGTVLTAVPKPADLGTVHVVDTWNMTSAENGQDMILTLCTPEGAQMSFAIKPWQVHGIATVATYGATLTGTSRLVH